MDTQPQFTIEQGHEIDHGTRDIPSDVAENTQIGGPLATWIAADGREISARAQSDGMVRIGVAARAGGFSTVYAYAWTGSEAAVLIKRAISNRGSGQIFRAGVA